MKYKNIKTGAIFESPCILAGKDIECIEEATDDIEAMKYNDLVKLAKAKGIDVKNLKKPELVDVIKRAL